MVAISHAIFADGFFMIEKFGILIKISLKSVPWGQLTITQHLDNGLASNRWQAFIWTNADPIHGRMYAALGEVG